DSFSKFTQLYVTRPRKDHVKCVSQAEHHFHWPTSLPSTWVQGNFKRVYRKTFHDIEDLRLHDVGKVSHGVLTLKVKNNRGDTLLVEFIQDALCRFTLSSAALTHDE